MNSFAEAWADYVGVMLWQSSVVMAVVLAAYGLLRKASASFRYALLCLVLVKFLLPPDLGFAAGARAWGERLWASVAPRETAKPEKAEIMPVNSTGIFERNALQPNQQASQAPAPALQAAGESAPHWRERLPLLLAIGWAGGLAGLLLGLGVHAARVHRSLGSARPVEDPALLELLARCRAELGVRRAVPLLSLPGLSSPLLFGVLRPRIILPARLREMDPRLLRPILLHELAHVKRHDLSVNALQIVLQTLWFFHPGIWLTNWLIRSERERACDDMVLRVLRGERNDYAESLIRVLEQAQPATAPGYGTLGILEGQFAMKTRFARILDEKRKISGRVSLAGLIAIVVLAAVILPLAKTQGENKFPNEPGRVWVQPPFEVRAGINEEIFYINHVDPGKGPIEIVMPHQAKPDQPDELEGLIFVGFDAAGQRVEFVPAQKRQRLRTFVMNMRPDLKPLTHLGLEATQADYQTKKDVSKVSRVKTDLRTLATAVESYFIDNNAYPAWSIDPALTFDTQWAKVNPTMKSETPTLMRLQDRSSFPLTLTSPVAYLTKIPEDPFAPDRVFRFYTAVGSRNGKQGWIAWSAGPDGKFDLDWKRYDPELFTGTNEGGEAAALQVFADVTYDPSNGTNSSGDIIRVKN
jgi:beta-lactamase regulating signal transducer with metallopeptidase domain